MYITLKVKWLNNRRTEIMKKNYIAPQTENVVLASAKIMQDSMAINTTSGGTFNDVTLID